MATTKAKTNRAERRANKTPERVQWSPEGIMCVRTNDTDYGIFCDISYMGMVFYGLRIVTGEKDGKDYEFISEPSHKGSNGQYYKYYNLNLAEETQKYIINGVFRVLDGEDFAHNPEDDE